MKRNQLTIALAGISTATLIAACGSGGTSSPVAGPATPSTTTMWHRSTDAPTPPDRTAPRDIATSSEATNEIAATHGTIVVGIGTAEFSASLADTDAARAFADRLPLTLDMTDVNSNEKAFDAGEALPADARNPGTVHVGDLMLYGSNTIVLFYESFDTPYTYTPIGRLDAPDGLAEVLGAGDVTVTFALP